MFKVQVLLAWSSKIKYFGEPNYFAYRRIFKFLILQFNGGGSGNITVGLLAVPDSGMLTVSIGRGIHWEAGEDTVVDAGGSCVTAAGGEAPINLNVAGAGLHNGGGGG